MPVNLNGSNGSAHEAKRPNRNPDRTRQQVEEVQQQSRDAISSLAKAGVNGINAQVFALDSKLTQFEKQTAEQLADRIAQSPVRIQHYLREELESRSNQADFDFFGSSLSAPDLSGGFLLDAQVKQIGSSSAN